MKTTLAIALLLVGMLALAVVREEPLQVWLMILAPFAFVGAAVFLERRPRLKQRRDAEINLFR
jgi:hypothetical protein